MKIALKDIFDTPPTNLMLGLDGLGGSKQVSRVGPAYGILVLYSHIIRLYICLAGQMK